MTREQQIKMAAEVHFAHSWSGSVMDAFEQGARWADWNPFQCEDEDKHPKDNLVDIDRAWDWLTNQKGVHTKEDFIKAMKGE